VNRALLEEFNRIGYRIYSLIPGLNMLAPFDRVAPLDPFQLNLFAAKDDCAGRLEQRGLLARRLDFDAPRARSDGDCWILNLENLTYAKRFISRWGRFRFGDSGLQRWLLDALPYTRRFLERWDPFRGKSDPDSLAYRDALNDYAEAYLPQTPAAYRPALLARSLSALSELLEGKSATFSRFSTWARVAADAGKRELAGKIAVGMIGAIDSGQLACEAGELFLSATNRFDGLDPGDEPAGWLVASLLEGAVRLGHYSSYFSGTATLPYLERLADSSYQNPEMERRRQLVRMQAGLQSHPEPCAVLQAQSTDNLNSEYWMAGRS